MKIKLSLAVTAGLASATMLAAVGNLSIHKKNSQPHNSQTSTKNFINEVALATAITDTPPPHINMHWPLHDQWNDFNLDPDINNFDLEDPAMVKKDITYDPITKKYYITEKVGNKDFKYPVEMSFDDFMKYQFKKDQQDYFKSLSDAAALTQHKGILPNVDVKNDILNRVLGSSKVDIRPNGNVELTFGGNFQNIQNPGLTVKQRRNGGFNFDMNIQMNVIGNIGDKLKLNVNYNTQSQFDIDNQVKLKYVGGHDDIIKSIEAGNVSLPLTTQLITGSSNIFGLKTALQFGRLTVTSVVSQQKTQKQSLTIQGGAQTSTFEINADEYDENRNFFLSQFFRDNYDKAMSTIPVLTSAINITKIEVWITNKTNQTVNNRDIVSFMDMGEHNKKFQPNTVIGFDPGNILFPATAIADFTKNSNDLYRRLTEVSDPNKNNYRSLDNSLTSIEANFGLAPVQDFEKTRAKKLTPQEYTLNSQLGYIMLNQQLQPDEVLAVAYEYTVNGKVFQVGEFAQDVPPNPDQPNVLFLKLLKSTSVRPSLPIWDLMMKNIYSLKAYQISSEDFHLDVYYQDPAGGARRFLPKGNNLSGDPLIRVLGLDRLNTQLDPSPDGVFDFVPNITIMPQNGKMIFPVLEPFGTELSAKFTNANDASKYVYQILYDSTKTKALQFPELDRYLIKGTYKSSVASDISLGAFNIPSGSVKVTAGGQQLNEGTDYTVDYNLGRLKILNQGVLASGVPINVTFENNDLFGFNVKSLFGTRLDYYINDKFKLGGTIMHLSERPYTKKLNVGDDPISNTIYGMDLSYSTNSGWLTRSLDRLPLLSTKETSTITFNGEFAHFIPGHSKAIGKDGTVYIDDFEGTQSAYDLKFPFSAWDLASTPQDFSEAKLQDSLDYGFHRAKLAWYSIDPLFQRNLASTPDIIKNDANEQFKPYTYEVFEKDIFRGHQTQGGIPDNLPTFDLNFNPSKKGPYNFTLNLDPNSGNLLAPSANWGGVMRSLDYNDFEQSNIEYIEFWLLDPNLDVANQTTTGSLYFNLGDVSEDILKDGKLFYENALPGQNVQGVLVDTTTWSRVGRIPPPVNAFSSIEADRVFQDVGFDGVTSVDENNFYKNYIGQLQTAFPSAAWVNDIATDPSNDDYRYYLDPAYNDSLILPRYMRYNNGEGNSPVNAGNNISFSATNIPESEDLNRDNTLNENEQYFQYKVSLDPNSLQPGQNFITDTVQYYIVDRTSTKHDQVTWYHFKIPISDYAKKVGNIADFKSIRFMRMFMTGYDKPVILRFAKLQLVRNQWRKYLFSLQNPGEYIPDDQNNTTYFNVSSVSLEENSTKTPVNYVMPPGIERELLVGQVSTVQQNEQSLSVQVCNLQDGDARSVFKTINLDMRTFDSLQLFVHAEQFGTGNPLSNKQLTAFVRLGSDFVSNYYEYEIPLTLTPAGSYSNTSDAERTIVWPEANNIRMVMDSLTAIKQRRNLSGTPITKPYVVLMSNGARITVVGNPDLGLVKSAMLGIRNPKLGSGVGDNDDGMSKCAEVWFNELRLSGFKENGGWAAIARTDIKLADFGQITLAGALHTIGFGQLEQKLNERFKDNFIQYDAAGTFQLGKLAPKSLGLQLPMYIGYSESRSNPQYDPYVLDILLKDELRNATRKGYRDTLRSNAQTFIAIKSLNFTNVRIAPTGKTKTLPTPFSIKNFNVSYAYTQTLKHNPTFIYDNTTVHHGEFAYLFPSKVKSIQPLNKLIKSKSPWFKLVKDANFNLFPTDYSFRTALDRSFNENQLRPIVFDDPPIAPSYNKFFTNDRIYGVKYNPFKSLTMDFNGNAHARIDEPDGKIDTKPKEDTVITNLKKLGRTITYNHAFNANYTVPLSKLPLVDWTQLTARYGSTYNWAAAPLIRDSATNKLIENPWGNTISNTQNIQLNGELNFRNLYAKFKWLKKYDTNASPQNITKPDKNGGDTKDDKDPKSGLPKNNTPVVKHVITTPQGFLIRTMLALKRVTITYTEQHNTVLPGYMFKPKFAGMDLGKTAPGWDFVFGMQPDSNWLKDKAKNGWLTKDTTLNMQFIQNFTKNLQMRASFEPIKDVMIDLNGVRNFTYNTSEYFKIPDGNTSEFKQLNRIESGIFSYSIISWKTAFDKAEDIFKTFEDNRAIISQQLGADNPNSGSHFVNAQEGDSSINYRGGYGPYSQDVLIPAFMAAYTGKDANVKMKGSYFNQIPLPNWRITYGGLTKLKAFKKLFSQFNVSHNYTSTYSIVNFSSSLDFETNPLYPSKIDPASGNFVSQYDIPGISITEQFAPLIGLDATWKRGYTTKFEYKKSRNLAMSFLDFTLNEMTTKEVSFNFGYKWKNFKVPFKINGRAKRLKNDLDIKCGISFADNKTIQRRLDITTALPTQGVKTMRINPTIDYVLNKNLQLQLFYDKTFTTPATSASFPINTTNFGVKVRFMLTQ